LKQVLCLICRLLKKKTGFFHTVRQELSGGEPPAGLKEKVQGIDLSFRHSNSGKFILKAVTLRPDGGKIYHSPFLNIYILLISNSIYWKC
jgi:hypothetical protein